MVSLSIISPSYRNDLELCKDLHASLRRFGPKGVEHQVIVPRKDLSLFAGIGEVHTAGEFLPRSFLAIPGNMWVNLKRPFPPVRGWITQQLIKIAAAAAAKTDVVLLVDSDLLFVRPFTGATFYQRGSARFYRSPDAIDERLPRHLLWHAVARRLLGLPPAPRPPLPDYICWPMAWDPNLVRGMIERVQQISGKPWPTVIGAELHFSEGILYGVYVDEIVGGTPFTEQSMLSAAYSGEKPLDATTARAFMATLSAEDIAVMISAKSRTDLGISRQALGPLEPAR